MVGFHGVSEKSNAWNGIKFMLAIETPDRKLWPRAPLNTGTFTGSVNSAPSAGRRTTARRGIGRT